MQTSPRAAPRPFDLRRDPQTRVIYRRLTEPGHPRLRVCSSSPPAGRVAITKEWTLVVAAPGSEVVRAAAADLRRFLRDAFGIRLAGAGSGRAAIRVSIDPERGRVAGQSKRDHVIVVRPGAIEIVGCSEWGAACGLYHLQRLLRLQSAPWLSVGKIAAAPALEPSLTCLAFKQGNMMQWSYPAAYHDEYLGRIARAGYTGFHLDVQAGLLAHSRVLPELNGPEGERSLEILRQIVARSRRRALDVHLVFYAAMFASDHPVFRRHPGLRGSKIIGTGDEEVRQALERVGLRRRKILATPGLHVLCSSHELTRRFYQEQLAQIFAAVPDLAGLYLIVGCEGLLHCYTAPSSRGPGHTDCPRCGRTEPEKTVSTLVNGIAAAVKRVNARAEVAVWPYGAFTWTKTPDARRLISRVSRDCAILTNFDTGDCVVREGVRSMSPDYSLSCVGPTPTYLRQITAARRRGLKVEAKVESGSPRDMNSVYMVPAVTRWARKYQGILDSRATGAMFMWEFVGYTESLSAELAGWMSWRPVPPTGKLLAALAARDFGAANAGAVVRAWRHFDRAMNYYPLSAYTTEFCRGPFGIGFAQPLVLDPREGGDRRHVVDLFWTHPFGAVKCLRTLRRMEQHWQRGVAILDRLAPPDRADAYRARQLAEHQALGRGVLCMIRTAINLVRFYTVRDEYFREASSLTQTRKRLVMLREIAKEELANAEAGRECLRQNILLGYDYVNQHDTFTEQMVANKIAQTKRLIDFTIPYRMFCHSFAMHRRDEWISDTGAKWR